jgi:YVTN family beta-propeller protein
MKTEILMTAIFLTASAIAFVKRTARHLTLLRAPLPLLLIVCALVPSARAEHLFVVTKESNTVAVIDSSTDEVITQIPSGSYPVRICTSPDRRKAYVSNEDDNTVSVIDTVAQAPIGTPIPVGPAPHESAVTPDGGRLFLVHENADFVTVIDTATNTVITENIVIGGNLAKDILFTLNGRFAYIANYSAGTVNIINTATSGPNAYRVRTIPTGAGARRLAISPAGDRVFVTNNGADSVSAIDTQTQQVIATIPVGHKPRGIAITPSGDAIYVGNVQSATVSIIDSSTLTVVDTIAVGIKPWQVIFTEDGTLAFVSSSVSGTVSVIDTATREVIQTLVTGNGSFFSVINPDGTKFYVSNSNDTTVSVVDISSLTVLDIIPDVGSYPFDMDFGP